MTDDRKHEDRARGRDAEGAPSDPVHQLEELQKHLGRDQAEIARLTRHKDALASDIAALTTVGNDVKAVLAAYEAALPNLQRDEKDDRAYAETKTRMILCAIEGSKDEIDAKIAETDEAIGAKREEVGLLANKKTESATALVAAQADLAERQARFDGWKAFRQTVADKLAAVADLRKKIEAEDDASHPASMYVYALELAATLDGLEVLSTDGLKAKLYRSWNALGEAKAAVRHRQSHLDRATAEYDAAKAELDAMVAGRVATLLALVAPYDARDDRARYRHA